MDISVFCGSSKPRNEQIAVAVADEAQTVGFGETRGNKSRDRQRISASPEWSASGNRLELSLFLRRLAFAVLLDDVAISLFFFAILSFV